jgi:hypothetical protein
MLPSSALFTGQSDKSMVKELKAFLKKQNDAQFDVLNITSDRFTLFEK